MAKFLTIIFLLIGFSVAAQSNDDSTKYVVSKTTYGLKYNRMTIDSIFYLPNVDTSFTPFRQGAIVFKRSNKKPYIWNGSYWVELAAGSGSQTWQQTLTTTGGSTLTQNNTIAGGGFDLKFNNSPFYVGTLGSNGNRLVWNDDNGLLYNQSMQVVADSLNPYLINLQNGCISGCVVTWDTLYTYIISPSTYRIGGVYYSSPADTITLSAADPTDDRIDAFVVNTSGLNDVVQGTPANPALAPDIDITTQLQISFAVVSHGTTSPIIDTATIYKENLGTPTEWNYTDNTATMTPSSTNFPYQGTYDIEGTTVAASVNFTLTAASSPTFTNYTQLNFKIRSKGAWSTGRGFAIQFLNGSTPIGNAVPFLSGSYNFISATTGVYQNVSIPLADFGNITNATAVRFLRAGTSTIPGFYIDNIILIGGASSGGGVAIQTITASSPITATQTGTAVNISTSMATNKLIGRSTAGTGVMEQITVGSGLSLSGGTLTATGSGGSVTNFSSGDLSPLFTTNVATSSTTPALTFTLSNAAAGTVFGNNGSSSAAPSYTSNPVIGTTGTNGTLAFRGSTSGVITIMPQVTAGTYNLNLPITAGTSGYLLTSAGGGSAAMTWTDPSTLSGVTTFSAGTTGFTPNSATSGAVTLAGTLDVDNGGTGQTSYTDGQLLIGNTSGNTLTKSTLTAGSGIAITNGNGSISIAATGTGGLAHVYAPLIISGDTISRRFNVLHYGADPTGVTDATVAIQNAINAANTAGGGEVFFPNGIYLIAGALQTNVGGINMNSQLYIPFRAHNDTLRNHIILLGESAPSFSIAGTTSSGVIDLVKSGVVLKSSLTSGATGATVIGTGLSGANWNDSYLTVKNITIQVKNNPGGTGPVVGGISYKNGASLICKDVVINIDTSGYRSTLPGNNVTGIETPNNSAGSQNILENTLVGGFRNGYILGEHVSINQAQAFYCYYAFNFKAGFHTANAARFGSYECAYDIYVSGSITFANLQLDAEYYTQSVWYDNVNTIKDSANLASGTVYYTIIQGFVGKNNALFSKSGGANINTYTHDAALVTASGNNTFSGTNTFNDVVSISASKSIGGVLLDMSNSWTGNAGGYKLLAGSLTAGSGTLRNYFGKALSTNDAVQEVWSQVSNGSNTNKLDYVFYGGNTVLSLVGTGDATFFNNLKWDAVNGRLGIGTTSPNVTLQAAGTGIIGGSTATFTSIQSGWGAGLTSLELNTGTAGTPSRLVFVTNQSSSAGAVGSTYYANSNLGTTEKRIAQFDVSTDGATNSGNYILYLSNAGTLAEKMRINANGSVVVGGVATGVYRTTNAGSDLTSKFSTNTGGSLSTAGSQAFMFDNTNGLVFGAGNGTREIARASIVLTNLTNTAASEKADLIFSTQQTAGAAITESLRLTNDGRLYGTALHNNAGAVTGTTTQYIASGTYTPTLTQVANVSAQTAYLCQWIRVGNVVTVTGKVDIDPTTTLTLTQLGVSLPIASNIANAQNCAGTFSASGVVNQGAVLGDATNDRGELDFTPTDVTNQSYYFTFTYTVL
jgi:hypothetical protein